MLRQGLLEASLAKINLKSKAMAKNNQKTIILDIPQGAKKRINLLTYSMMLGGPFLKSHPVLYSICFMVTILTNSCI